MTRGKNVISGTHKEKPTYLGDLGTGKIAVVIEEGEYYGHYIIKGWNGTATSLVNGATWTTGGGLIPVRVLKDGEKFSIKVGSSKED